MVVSGAAAFLLHAQESSPKPDSSAPKAGEPEKKLPKYKVLISPPAPSDRTGLDGKSEEARQAFEKSLNLYVEQGYQFAGMNDNWIVLERKEDSGRRRVVLPSGVDSARPVDPSR